MSPTNARDPRKDPRPGDVLKIRGQVYVAGHYRTPKMIWLKHQRTQVIVPFRLTTLEKAEVLHVAD